MPLTYTGRRVRPGGTEHPGILDIAVGMSRQPRFAGQTQRWFSVLDHSLFVDDLAIQQQGIEIPRNVRLALLLHDAHESMTGDVPSDWKPEQLKMHQLELDQGIMGAYFPGGVAAYHDLHETVKHFDRRALIAEARLVGPPVHASVILDAFGATEDTHADAIRLQNLLVWDEAFFGVPPRVSAQENHPGVQEYLKRVFSLL